MRAQRRGYEMRLEHCSTAQRLDLNALRDLVSLLFDQDYYLSCNPDVAKASIEPLDHFLLYGAAERRLPNQWFNPRWYIATNPDVAVSLMDPLVHYLISGAEELRDPGPEFDAVWYSTQHPEAVRNPLWYHLTFGRTRNWPTLRPFCLAEHLPSELRELPSHPLAVDVIIPVYKGLEDSQRCLFSVMRHTQLSGVRVIVINDASPDPELSAWLATISGIKNVVVLLNDSNIGFVGSVNRGMSFSRYAGRDVVLLNSDTEVPAGWLERLAKHAYASRDVGTVTPFSNNATICSYPTLAGGDLSSGVTLDALDAAAQTANAGRSVNIPTAIGFCMYIRADCLKAVGVFDEQNFGRGYGEENDFCLRASRLRWRHLLACDTFVYHRGEVSFGKDSADRASGQIALDRLNPEYKALVRHHVLLDPSAPARFALAAALMRASSRPKILHVSHNLGGGVREHIQNLAIGLAHKADHLLLEPSERGICISVLFHKGHLRVSMQSDEITSLTDILRSCGITRIHVHSWMGFTGLLRRLISELAVPFDVTVHDYFAICPQINLLPQPDENYCWEPDIAGCNACITNRPSHGAVDIVSWRRSQNWIFSFADRVICPTEDVRRRIARYGLAARAIVVPHDTPAWEVQPYPLGPLRENEVVRVAVIGVLADHKGAQTVANVARRLAPEGFRFHLVGYAEDPTLFPSDLFSITGRYEPQDIHKILLDLKPHVILYAGSSPETYSYSLNACLDLGLPVVAADIGAFAERLSGRALTWLVVPAAPVEAWAVSLCAVRDSLTDAVLTARAKKGRKAPSRAISSFYTDGYLSGVSEYEKRIIVKKNRSGLRSETLKGVTLRAKRQPTLVVIPELLTQNVASPCAYIRLLQPLDHLACSTGLNVHVATAFDVADKCNAADLIVTHRIAVSTLERAEQLVTHCRRSSIPLVYDLDDALLGIGETDHIDAASYALHEPVVRAMIGAANLVTVSTKPLACAIAKLAHDIVVVPNGLDERLWQAVPAVLRQGDPIRILYMGTMTHAADLELVMPALERLHHMHKERVRVEILGITGNGLPSWLTRVPTPDGTGCYPRFVDWITRQGRWHIGIAPLIETPFTALKSAIKALDYAALGMAIVASDVPAYRGSIADGVGGVLVRNQADEWYVTLDYLVRNPRVISTLAASATEALRAAHTLISQVVSRRVLLQRSLRYTRAF